MNEPGDHCATPAGAATAEPGGYRYGVDLQRILRDFLDAGGIELRFDHQGRLAGVGLRRRCRRPAGSCDVGNLDLCRAECDCAGHDRPLTGPDRSGTDR